jgi:hypothetical protein
VRAWERRAPEKLVLVSKSNLVFDFLPCLHARPISHVFDAWGFDRCLWGTDWTRAFAVVNYEQAVEPFLKTDRLSATERAMLMGGACAKAYGWSPKKG